tara:strand:- start:94 stop:942 length:849 start_codon:yes stop_codon:yes gene_type:complete
MALTKVPNELSSTPSIVDGGNATAITITSDEDLLIGAAASESGIAKTFIEYAATSQYGLEIHDSTTATTATNIAFYKNTNFVGSLGTVGLNTFVNSQGGTLKVSTAGVERYNADEFQIYPSVDNKSSLGLSSSRFKDLYLSGGVVFPDASAATGASVNGNKLDSYEEGSFTPTAVTGFSGFSTLQSARYTKIGNIVHIQLYTTGLSGKTSALLHMGGLPFTCKVNGWAPGSMNYSGTTMSNPHPRARAGEARIDFKKNDDDTMSGTDITGHLLFQLTYKTDG